MHVLQFFFSAVVEDAAMTAQRAAMQAASRKEVRTALRRAVPLFRRDASDAPDSFEGIVFISLLPVGPTRPDVRSKQSISRPRIYRFQRVLQSEFKVLERRGEKLIDGPPCQISH